MFCRLARLPAPPPPPAEPGFDAVADHGSLGYDGDREPIWISLLRA